METALSKRYRFYCDISFIDIFLQLLIWGVVTVVTLGIALPFFAYYMIRKIINSTELIEVDVSQY